MLLAIDTSTRQLGVAFYANERILGEINWVAGYHATEQLMASINQLWAMIAGSGQAPEPPAPTANDAPAPTVDGLHTVAQSRIPISAVRGASRARCRQTNEKLRAIQQKPTT